MTPFGLKIVTPDGLIFDGQADKVVVRTTGGDVCILARHIDYAAPLGIGEARVTDASGNTRAAACSGGMVSVSGGVVRLIATTFEWADEIDRARAQRAHEAAAARLVSLKHDDAEYALVEAKLKRALVRMNVKG